MGSTLLPISGPVTVRRKPPRLTKVLVGVLAEQIRNGHLRSGDKLPTESEIMLEHGVSRTVVREAISGLQSAGFVETKHGIGTFVLDLVTGLEFRIEPSSVPTVLDILAMLELRISLESEAAALAAARRTPSQLAELNRLLEEFHARLNVGGDTVEPDFQFHLTIANATGNRYFPEVLSRFGTTTIPRTRITMVQSSGGQAAYLGILCREHEQIYNAILRGDPEGASMFMRTHLSSSRDRFQKAQAALAGQ
jgi:GntR family transcriptional regulator, transcriptional repressor for pyruvate dehydrogenase complex